MRVRVHELRFENKVIGYRVTDQGFNKAYDMSVELFDYAYEKYFKNLTMVYGFPFNCMLDGDYYVTESDCRLRVREIADESGVESLISYWGIKSFYPDDAVKNRLIYRYFICSRRLLNLGIPLGGINAVELNSRMHSYWGRCSRRIGYKRFDIDIAERLLLSADDEGVDIVVIHELLHTCEGCMNHGSMWKHWGNVVCNAFGYKITRLSSADDLGSDPTELIMMGYHACQCMNCGNVVVKKTECDFIKYYDNYSCAICGGSFMRIS